MALFALFLITYSTSDYEHPFFLPTDPLDDFICALDESIPAGGRAGHAVQFEQRRDPGQRYEFAADAMVDFEMGRFRMYA